MKYLLFYLLVFFILGCGSCGNSKGQADTGVVSCATDKDCPIGMYCVGGLCESLPDGSAGCQNDADCPEGHRCEVLTRQCLPVDTDGGGEPVDGGVEDGGDAGGDVEPECSDGETRDCGPPTEVGECDYGVEQCVDGFWSGVCAGAVYPEAEKCDGLDNDCDGETPADEIDQDGDRLPACAGDCNDSDPDIYPGHAEICDGKDNNCDGAIDQESGEGVCDIGEICSDTSDCRDWLYCQYNSNEGEKRCSHWCNNSFDTPAVPWDHECPADHKCLMYYGTDSAGFCWPNSGGTLDTGANCGSDDDCRSGWCDAGHCIDGCSSFFDCRHTGPGTRSWSCVVTDISWTDGVMTHGLCGPQPGSGVTGDPCSDYTYCRDGFCDTGRNECLSTCRTELDCLRDNSYVCFFRAGEGSSIFRVCRWVGTYGSNGFGTACSISGADSNCRTTLCLDVGSGLRCNRFCCRDADCPSGYKCDFAYSVDMHPHADAVGRACVPE